MTKSQQKEVNQILRRFKHNIAIVALLPIDRKYVLEQAAWCIKEAILTGQCLILESELGEIRRKIKADS